MLLICQKFVQLSVERGLFGCQNTEKFIVESLDLSDSLRDEFGTFIGDSNYFGAGVGLVFFPCDEVFALQSAHYLRGSHWVYLGEIRQRYLRDFLSLLGKPLGTRQEYKLGVCEVERLQHFFDSSLP